MEEVRQATGLTLVALPYVSKDGFAGACVKSLLDFAASGHNVKFHLIGDSTQVWARNEACREAMRVGAEWLWFVDSDQDFPPYALGRLKAVGADVACADMWSRTWPSFRIVIRLGERGESGLRKSESVPDSEAVGIKAISYCGMGCTLIRVSVLERMKERFPEPWFWTAEHAEDATFCFKVLEIGGSVKCDFGVKSGHWSYCRMMGQEFTRDRKNLEGN